MQQVTFGEEGAADFKHALLVSADEKALLDKIVESRMAVERKKWVDGIMLLMADYTRSDVKLMIRSVAMVIRDSDGKGPERLATAEELHKRLRADFREGA